MKMKVDETSFFWQIIGPLFVICTFSLTHQNYLLLFVSILGLFTSAKYRIPGFLSSLVLLGGVSLMEHLTLDQSHAWQFGLECSYALAFYITAISSDRHYQLINSLFSQLKIKDSSMQILEEEFARTQSETTKQQIQQLEKIDSLQKSLEEITAEQSSLSMLNEVLRKTTAKHIESNEAITLELYEYQNRLAFEIAEKERLSNLKGDAIENAELNLKIKTLQQENEKLIVLKNETVASVESKIQAFSQENEQMKIKYETLLQQEKESYQKLSDAKTYLETELLIKMSFLEKALENQKLAAQEQQDLSQEKQHVLEQKAKEYLQMSLLYKQLKTQFEEKNQILHKTRSELFIKDTELQTLQIAHKELETNVPQELLRELTGLEKDLAILQEENNELQNLVTVLARDATPESKKKVRMNPDQFTLF